MPFHPLFKSNILVTPPVQTTSDATLDYATVSVIVIVLIIVLFIVAALATSRKKDPEPDTQPKTNKAAAPAGSNSSQSNTSAPEGKKRHGWIKVVLVLAAIAFIFLWVIPTFTGKNNHSNNLTTPQLFSRAATSKDIIVNLREDIALSANYEITPNVDIEDLQLTFKFYNDDNRLLDTIVKNVGNVSEGTVYTVSISFDELGGIFAVLDISYSRTSVSGGTVSYFS